MTQCCDKAERQAEVGGFESVPRLTFSFGKYTSFDGTPLRCRMLNAPMPSVSAACRRQKIAPARS